MAADGITKGVEWNRAPDIEDKLNDKSSFELSSTPQAGDIFAWSEHTGTVESYNEDTKKVTVLHSTQYSYTKDDGTVVKVSGTVRETYPLSYFTKKDNGKGVKFGHPKVETPDVIGKTYTGKIEGNVKPIQDKTKIEKKDDNNEKK